jgi:hypothetical protein
LIRKIPTANEPQINFEALAFNADAGAFLFFSEDLMLENSAKGEKKLSREILSVLLIVSADFYLQQSTRQYISIEDQAVNWDALFKLRLNDSHKAAIIWAHCIWKNEIPSGSNPFVMASSMEPEMKKVILEALKFRWSTES